MLTDTVILLINEQWNVDHTLYSNDTVEYGRTNTPIYTTRVQQLVLLLLSVCLHDNSTCVYMYIIIHVIQYCLLCVQVSSYIRWCVYVMV